MAGAGLSIVGLKELVKHLESLGIETQDLKAAMHRIGNIVAVEGRSRVTVVSGDLSGTIRASKSKNKAVVRAGGARVKYAGVNHFGRYFVATGTRVAGTYFLKDAARVKTPEMLREIEAEMQVLIRKAGLA